MLKGVTLRGASKVSLIDKTIEMGAVAPYKMAA